LDLSPDGTTLYVADLDSGQISVLDVASRREVRRLDIPGPPLGVAVSKPVSVAVADDGKVLVTTATDGEGLSSRSIR
jgi:YVTN family beta-propeller protein